MQIRKTSSCLLSALALAAVSVPSAVPAVAQANPDVLPPAVCIPSSPRGEYTLGDPGIATISDALVTAKACGITGRVVVNVPVGDGIHPMPPIVPEGFSEVVITGSGGALGMLTQARTEAGVMTTKVKSPLTLTKVKVEDIQTKLMDTTVPLTIREAEFTGTSPEAVVVHASSSQGDNAALNLERNVFVDTQAVQLNNGFPRVTITGNMFAFESQDPAVSFALGPISMPVSSATI